MTAKRLQSKGQSQTIEPNNVFGTSTYASRNTDDALESQNFVML